MIFENVPAFLDALTRLPPETKRGLTPCLGFEKFHSYGYRERGTDNYWTITIHVWRAHYLGSSPIIVRREVDGTLWPSGTIGLIEAQARFLQDLRKALPNYGSEGGYLIDQALVTASEHEDLPTAWSRLLGDDDQIGVD